MLSGAGIKGATVKALVPFVLDLARSLDDGTDRKHSRRLMMDGLADFYNVMLASDVFLTETQLRALDDSVYQRLANYSKQAYIAMSAGQVRYNIVQKHHMMAHIPFFARNINPRMVATHVEESFIAQGPVCKV